MEKPSARERSSERGQSMIMLAMAFVTLLIIVGLAIDLGLVYVERVRLDRATDAAALGAVPELPHEEAAFIRALMFLSDNGYDANNSVIYFNGVWQDWSLSPDEAAITLRINTADYLELDAGGNPIANTARRVRVEGVQRVPLHFMRFIGQEFSDVPVTGKAVAENVQNLDVAVVFDRSGSMEYDTICYGCWEVADNRGYDYDRWPSGRRYPAGVRHPMSYPNELCSGYGPEDTYSTHRGHDYVVIEAEHYTNSWPPFDPDYRDNKSSYWALQRSGVGSSAYNDACGGSNWRAGCGGYMQHNPFRASYVEQVYDSSEIGQAPQLTYDFRVPTSGRYRLWLREQGGCNWGGDGPTANPDDWSLNVDESAVHWALNRLPQGTVTSFPDSGSSPGCYDGARADAWRWQRVDEFSLTAGVTHTLEILAGGAGFRLDKIVITNELNDGVADDIIRDRGPDATAGRSGWACWPCNPIYGPPSSAECQAYWAGNPLWQSMYDAMFDDQQPVRAAKEAVKLFLNPPQELENRLDPQFDQVGLVSYSDRSEVDSELECIVHSPDSCLSFESVEDAVELLDSGGNTNIAEGLQDAISVLGRGGGHYGRPATKKFIILMTDGVPNRKHGVSGCGDLYPHDGGSGTPHDCAVYVADQAARNGISIYTIGLGEGVDEVLLNQIADLTDGAYFPAPDKDDLDEIFMQILNRIYIRLVE
ncbi:MAG: VWA domain-containing protein [Anaerolineae bacterium]|nr:MAG: VWA domain-containing protein [Anaerolineae bacterium]